MYEIMNEGKQIKLGTVLSYIQVVLNIVVSVLYTPLMIKFLGTSDYGLYNTVSSTISSLSILSLGFGGGYIKFFAKYKKNNDEESIAKLNGLFVIIFSIISIITFACGVFLTYNLNLVFSTGLTSAEYATAKVLMWLLTINLSSTFLFSVFTTIITSHEKFVFLKICNIIKVILKPVTGVIIMFMGFGSIGLVCSILSVTFLIDFINMYYVLRKLKQKFIFKDFEKGIFKSLFRFTIFIAINSIVDQINLSIDKILIGRFWGTSSVAVYAVGMTLYEGFQMFSTAISEIFVPRVYRLNEVGDEQGVSKLFAKIGRIQFIILSLLVTGFVIFGKYFLQFWVGEGFEEAYIVTVLLMVSVLIPLCQNVGINIQRAKNKHQFRSLVYLAMAFVNLVTSIILCKRYGIVGSAIGTAISFIVANGLIMNIYYHKAIGLDIGAFFKNILRVSVGLIIPAGLGVVIMLFVPMNSIWIMLVLIVVYALVYFLSMYFLAMNSDEKRYVKIVFDKLLFFRKGKKVVKSSTIIDDNSTHE